MMRCAAVKLHVPNEAITHAILWATDMQIARNDRLVISPGNQQVVSSQPAGYIVVVERIWIDRVHCCDMF